MPNKITDEVLSALLSAHLFADPLAAMERALQAYERAKWRQGVPTEDGKYLCLMKKGSISAYEYKNGFLYDLLGGMLGEYYTEKIAHHQPFPEPPKEGE